LKVCSHACITLCIIHGCTLYHIRGNFHGTKFLLYSMLTRFLQLYFRWPHILSFRGSHIPSFCACCQRFNALFSASPGMTDSVCLAAYHHTLKTTCIWTCKCTNRTWKVANSYAILLQSNRVGIFWIPIFTFAKHNLADRRIPDPYSYTWWPRCNCLEWRAR